VGRLHDEQTQCADLLAAGDGTWGTPYNVSSASATTIGDAAIAYDAAGDATAVWATAAPNYVVVPSTRPAGGSWSTPLTLGTVAPGGTLNTIDMATGPAGETAAVWQSVSGGVNIIQESLKPAGGAFPATASRLAEISAAHRGRAKLPIGDVFSLDLNETATLTLTYSRTAAGRTVNRTCVAPSGHNRHAKACVRTLSVGAISEAGKAGSNAIGFYGELRRGHALPYGTYTVTISAEDGTGLVSKPVKLSFTIAK
jgi:hypothetical protein